MQTSRPPTPFFYYFYILFQFYVGQSFYRLSQGLAYMRAYLLSLSVLAFEFEPGLSVSYIPVLRISVIWNINTMDMEMEGLFSHSLLNLKIIIFV